MLSTLFKFNALLRAAWHEALAYRAVLVIWVLAGALPLIMLGVWLPLSSAGLVTNYSPGEFVAYYVGVIALRQFTSVWVIWDIEREIRLGELSSHLLRPCHPLLRYLAQALADKPLRALLTLPLFAAVLLLVPGAMPQPSALELAVLPLAIALAFSLYFALQVCIALLAFWLTQVIALQDFWFAVFTLASGYLLPLDLFPPLVVRVLRVLPFRYLLSFPLELLLGKLNPAQVAEGLLFQVGWGLFFASLMLLLWRRGLRQYGAVGA
jgi:ABC-2 type transport system permease protein